jgi:DNA (cytosine-5)-methyltransferase 1
VGGRLGRDEADGVSAVTVREAARLQSIPDGFVVAGTMNPAFRQIGNAILPVIARETAKVILTSLRVAMNARVDRLVAAE